MPVASASGRPHHLRARLDHRRRRWSLSSGRSTRPDRPSRTPADGHADPVMPSPRRGGPVPLNVQERRKRMAFSTAACRQFFRNTARLHRLLDAALHDRRGVLPDRAIDEAEGLCSGATAILDAPADHPAGIGDPVWDAQHTTVVQHRLGFWGDGDVRPFEHQPRPHETDGGGRDHVAPSGWDDDVAVSPQRRIGRAALTAGV